MGGILLPRHVTFCHVGFTSSNSNAGVGTHGPGLAFADGQLARPKTALITRREKAGQASAGLASGPHAQSTPAGRIDPPGGSSHGHEDAVEISRKRLAQSVLLSDRLKQRSMARAREEEGVLASRAGAGGVLRDRLDGPAPWRATAAGGGTSAASMQKQMQKQKPLSADDIRKAKLRARYLAAAMQQGGSASSAASSCGKKPDGTRNLGGPAASATAAAGGTIAATAHARINPGWEGEAEDGQAVMSGTLGGHGSNVGGLAQASTLAPAPAPALVSVPYAYSYRGGSFDAYGVASDRQPCNELPPVARQVAAAGGALGLQEEAPASLTIEQQIAAMEANLRPWVTPPACKIEESWELAAGEASSERRLREAYVGEVPEALLGAAAAAAGGGGEIPDTPQEPLLEEADYDEALVPTLLSERPMAAVAAVSAAAAASPPAAAAAGAATAAAADMATTEGAVAGTAFLGVQQQQQQQQQGSAQAGGVRGERGGGARCEGSLAAEYLTSLLSHVKAVVPQGGPHGIDAGQLAQPHPPPQPGAAHWPPTPVDGPHAATAQHLSHPQGALQPGGGGPPATPTSAQMLSSQHMNSAPGVGYVSFASHHHHQQQQQPPQYSHPQGADTVLVGNHHQGYASVSAPGAYAQQPPPVYPNQQPQGWAHVDPTGLGHGQSFPHEQLGHHDFAASGRFERAGHHSHHNSEHPFLQPPSVQSLSHPHPPPHAHPHPHPSSQPPPPPHQHHHHQHQPQPQPHTGALAYHPQQQQQQQHLHVYPNSSSGNTTHHHAYPPPQPAASHLSHPADQSHGQPFQPQWVYSNGCSDPQRPPDAYSNPNPPHAQQPPAAYHSPWPP
eukprot:jgi/Mesen1/606/ME000108S10764